MAATVLGGNKKRGKRGKNPKPEMADLAANYRDLRRGKRKEIFLAANVLKS